MSQPNLSSLLWSVADLLRGDYKASEYGRVILPFTLLRRLDCVLEDFRSEAVAEQYQRCKDAGLPIETRPSLKAVQHVFNTSLKPFPVSNPPFGQGR